MPEAISEAWQCAGLPEICCKLHAVAKSGKAKMPGSVRGSLLNRQSAGLLAEAQSRTDLRDGTRNQIFRPGISFEFRAAKEDVV